MVVRDFERPCRGWNEEPLGTELLKMSRYIHFKAACRISKKDKAFYRVENEVL